MGVSLKAKATFVASCVFSAGMIYFVPVNQQDERQVRHSRPALRTARAPLPPPGGCRTRTAAELRTREGKRRSAGGVESAAGHTVAAVRGG